MIPDIRKFEESGATKEEHLHIKKGFVTDKLTKQMRAEGYVPVLDIFPQMITSYDHEKEVFFYTIALYGVEVEDAWKYEGWLDGRLLQATTKTKSGQFYSIWESL